MSNFWPSGLDLSDTQSPWEILLVAQEDWYQSSGGIMELVLQDAISKSGNSMIIVHAKHVPSNRTSTLLSVIHRPDNPYPVTIQLEDENLPNFLKKSYSTDYSRGLVGIAAVLASETISNKWISDTPAEFRKKLAEAFNLGGVKSRILNLASSSSNALDDTNEEPQVDDTNEEPQVDDTSEELQVDDTNEELQVDDTNEESQVDDTNEEPQVDDTNEELQIDDTNEEPKVDSTEN